MKVLKWLDDNLEAALMVILLALITCVMFLQIIMTNVFRNALNWPDEFCRICFIYSGFLCFALCQKKRNAIKIDVLVNMLPEGGRKVVNAIGEILLFVCYVFLFYHSLELMKVTIANGSRTSAMQVPIAFEYFALTLGMALSIFRAVEEFVKGFFLKKGGEKA